MPEIIEDWDDIVENSNEFVKIIENKQNLTYERFSLFRLWYYFPKEKTFAPNKFLINKNTTLENYSGEGFSANRDNATLLKYFDQIPKEEMFYELYSELEEFAFRITGSKASLNLDVLHGNGGIFVPKEKFTYNQFGDEENNGFSEGKVKRISVNRYERDKNARKKCIEHYGYKCDICGIILSDLYGNIAEDFIHIHHIIELSQIREEYTVDPINDLRPLCPNCHSIIHRKTPALSLEELKKRINIFRN